MPQFELENRSSYYEAYSDNIMSGSAKPPWGGGWNRGVIGSVVSGSEEWKAEVFRSYFEFEKAYPYFRSGEVRNIRLASSTQQINDSITPDIVQLWKTGSSTPDIAPVDYIGLFGLLVYAVDGKIVTGSDGKQLNNTEWNYSFPFEKKYYAVGYERTTPVALRITASYYFIDTGWFSPGAPNIFEADYVVHNWNKYFLLLAPSNIQTAYTTSMTLSTDELGYVTSSGSWHTTKTISTYASNHKARNSLFFGVNPQTIHTASSKIGGQYNNYEITHSAGCLCEGWKYGLYNGIPTNFSAVFRQNKFGQFRDMLEGRIYTKTFNNPNIGGPMDANGGINFISASSLPGESDNWLTASIYGGTNVTEAYRVNPYGSGIFDKEYRASQPWHDDDPRVGT